MNSTKIHIKETYRKVETLGQGTNYKVYKVKWDSDQTNCFLKQVDISNQNDEEKNEIFRTAKIMGKFKHPNIVDFKESYKTKAGKIHIVVEYIEGCTLDKHLKKQKKYLTEDKILDLFTQLWLVIKYIKNK